jgi:electron transport complex protein RnfE
MQTQKSNARYQLSDGLIKQNIVLMSSTAVAPVAVCATNFENALAISVGFTMIAFLSVLLCRLIPKKIVYTIRITIYAVIAGLAFIPTYIALTHLYGEEIVRGLGVYLPILAVNPLILTKTETRFSLRPPHLMMLELSGYITGFNVVCLSIGILRDILTNRKIAGFELDAGFAIPALSTTFGGLIVVGVMAGLFRYLYNSSKERKAKREEKERQRLALISRL